LIKTRLSIEDKFSKVMDFIIGNKYRAAGRLLAKMLRTLDPSQYEQFYPPFKEVIFEAGLAFMEEMYPEMMKGMGKERRQRLLEFETPFIRQYCLIPNEQLLQAFYGTLGEYNYIIEGRIFVTNLRVLVSGARAKKSSGVYTGNLLSSLIVNGIIAGIRSAKSNALQVMRDTFASGPGDVLGYGFVYPYINNHDLRRENNNDITYVVDFEYDDKGTLKNLQMPINISVLMMKGQRITEFKSQQNELSYYLYTLFQSVSQQS
jgi:hypothetical protein